jgi:hypothetical protein
MVAWVVAEASPQAVGEAYDRLIGALVGRERPPNTVAGR